MSLPNDAKQRKAVPLFEGLVKYFPDALVEVARVSYVGNQQHNPGQPLHWAREKSTDQMDCAMRHAFDHAQGNVLDTDECYHLAKAAWRVLAELQLTIERRRAADARDAKGSQGSGPVADLGGQRGA